MYTILAYIRLSVVFRLIFWFLMDYDIQVNGHGLLVHDSVRAVGSTDLIVTYTLGLSQTGQM